MSSSLFSIRKYSSLVMGILKSLYPGPLSSVALTWISSVSSRRTTGSSHPRYSFDHAHGDAGMSP